MSAPEPELVGVDGTVRKAYYGDGIQPWDLIVGAGWGPAFAAGNALKYVRRHRLKNGEDDLKKARWYLTRLTEMIGSARHASPRGPTALETYRRFLSLVTEEELALILTAGDAP